MSSLITKGLIHIQLKQHDQAETSFRRALSVEKNHAMALVRLGYCRLLGGDYHDAIQFFQRALQQRCGTVALPKSVKGTARVYTALALMAQQDTDGALTQLSEARRNHKNFAEVCTGARDAIINGDCEGLVQSLRSICDLDVNTAQSWQLVHLMAKELELESHGAPTSPGVAKPALSEVAGASMSGAMPPTAQAADSQNGEPSGASQNPPASKDVEPIPKASKDVESIATHEAQKPFGLEPHQQIDYGDLTMAECLVSGGFGAVYRGTWKGAEVAIKRLYCEDGGNISSTQLAELGQEVAALQNLTHPRLVSFMGACLQTPNLCIITEFMAGGSLHALLHKNQTPLTRTQQATMALQITEGVAYLHSLRPPFVHRDLKSMNVILDSQLNAKLCDFGLTQSMEKTHISLKDNGNGGSPRYMAPECYGMGRITEKVDVWAMGLILIEVFGGPVPYNDCTSIHQIVAKLLVEKALPYIPNHLPRGVKAIVVDCLHFEHSRRTTAQDVHSHLRQLRLIDGDIDSQS